VVATVLVTGATGNVGRPLVEELRRRGADVRAADRDPTRQGGDGNVARVRFDWQGADTWDDAFAGVERVFVLRPPHLSKPRTEMVPALERAKALGVRHVVFLSLQGAENNRVVPHRQVEDWCRSSGLDWTFVRASFFMENLTTTHRSDIRDRDELMVPAGRGATAFVAAADVAAVAAAALTEQGHAGVAWTPTGDRAWTYDEIANVLSDVLGRPIRYARPGALRYLVHAVRRLRMPVAMAAVTLAIYTVARLGRAGGLTDDVRTVLGRRPISFEDWARDHRTDWQR
jgi:uncharacterized protein YbjT (DUF2867 family)